MKKLAGAMVAALILAAPQAAADSVWTSPDGAISLTFPPGWEFGPITGPNATSGNVSMLLGAGTRSEGGVLCTVGRETTPNAAAFDADTIVDPAEMNRRLAGRMRNLSIHTIDGVQVADYDVVTPMPVQSTDRVQIVRRFGKVFNGVGYVFAISCSGGRPPHAEPPRDLVMSLLQSLRINH